MNYLDTGWRTNRKTGGKFNVLEKVDRLDYSGWEGLNEEATFYKNALTNYDPNLFVLHSDKDTKAFISFSAETGFIKMLGSTGKGAGTESFIQALEAMRDNETNRVGAKWEAPTDDAESYYAHIGLDKYRTDNPFTKEYWIPKKELGGVIHKLRNRKSGKKQGDK